MGHVVMLVSAIEIDQKKDSETERTNSALFILKEKRKSQEMTQIPASIFNL